MAADTALGRPPPRGASAPRHSGDAFFFAMTLSITCTGTALPSGFWMCVGMSARGNPATCMPQMTPRANASRWVWDCGGRAAFIASFRTRRRSSFGAMSGARARGQTRRRGKITGPGAKAANTERGSRVRTDSGSAP